MAIYDLMRNTMVPVQEIRETALAQLSMNKLEQNLFHENEAVRYWAAISLGNQPEKISDIKILHKALDDETPVVRFAVGRALSKLDQATVALPVIVKGLEHKDEWVRLNAAQILDEMGEHARPTLTSLQAAMNDSNKYVVRVVNHAINELLKINHEVP
jgi:HEAT repeat protein